MLVLVLCVRLCVCVVVPAVRGAVSHWCIMCAQSPSACAQEKAAAAAKKKNNRIVSGGCTRVFARMCACG